MAVTASTATDRIIALDAMGGDSAPKMVVAGANIARERYPDFRFLFVGPEEDLRNLLKGFPELEKISDVRHAADKISGDMKPSQALRAGRQSSMQLAINAVASGEAACVVSAGNTGALMAMAKLTLRTLPGIDRPAIASLFPTLRGESVMLDLGANVDSPAEHLVQFALMGALFARVVLGIKEPSIGLLNIGSEAPKGPEQIRAAAERLSSMELPGTYGGYVEGNDVPAGAVDVVVTDGFTGNVALKISEGTKLVSEWLRQTFRSSFAARLGYLFARRSFLKLRTRTDPRHYNGAMFLGLKGICVKSHGGTDAAGFANAIGVAVDLVREGFNEKVKTEFERYAAPTVEQEQKEGAGS